MTKKVFKYLLILLILMPNLYGCDQFKPADEDSWEGGYDEGSYYPGQPGDTTKPLPDYYDPNRTEYYKLTCILSDSIKTLYSKTILIDTAGMVIDSLKVISGKKYNFKFYGNWDGANPANTLQFNIDKTYYYVKLAEKEEGIVSYTDFITPKQVKLYIRFGVLRAYQDIGN